MKKSVLISGASIAGLSTAFWMSKLGYQVTIVEIADQPRIGGSPVDVRGIALDVSKRMGIFEKLKERRLEMDTIEFKDVNDVTQGSMLLKNVGAQRPDEDIEISRNDLVTVLYQAIEDNVEFQFNDSIENLEQTENNVIVTFTNDPDVRRFDLVIGCDGLHSNVRRLIFGPEAEFVHFLGQYFSIAGVNGQLIKPNTGQMYNVPGKACTLYAYNGKTDVIFAFLAENEIPYNYRDTEQQKQIIIDAFDKEGWRTNEFLEEIKKADNFYFDKLCQVKMTSWTKGKIALVGDSGYCASPASGMGASLSMIGAAALADALVEAEYDIEKAFKQYNQSLRPFIEEIQATASIGSQFLIPRSAEDIKIRNGQNSIITTK
jgi:2-polyprenyl-6-methoxyphenol hydroxylase-like FAD-dependent oxidoreductase